MTTRTNSQATKTVNFIVGLALLVAFFPVAGKCSAKPAGVRTAVEMIANKPSLRKFATDAAAA